MDRGWPESGACGSARAIDRSLTTGAHGLPLFGCGDWNDGMNRVGREGQLPRLPEPAELPEDIRDLVRYNLEKAGFRVAAAGDGEEGLRQLFAARPDALVLDLLLPGLGGMDVLRTLRGEGNRVPILMLTARDGDDRETLNHASVMRRGHQAHVLVVHRARAHVARRCQRACLPGSHLRRQTQITLPAATQLEIDLGQ